VKLAKSLIDNIKDFNFIWDNKSYSIGASVGIVNFKPGDITLETVLSQADIACYTAKNQGGNRVNTFTGTDSEISRYFSEIQLAPKVQKAIHERSFQLYTQKICPLQNDPESPPYYEILLRIEDDNGQLILPNLFLKIAERQNMMAIIDEWVTEKILHTYANDILACGQFNISMNISATSIHSPEFHQHLDKLLTETRLDKSKIGFELKEAAFLTDVETAQQFLSILKKHGCCICLDNFGQGMQSFQHFKCFPHIHIKINGDYIHDIDTNPINYAIVDSMNQLGHKLGAKTVAALVESESIVNSARKIGIDYAQGYAVSKVIQLDDLIKNLNANGRKTLS
jgi:EAL domain-containing protein (putative c-di-GMP-specific phosphodiesterase class I)